MNNTSSNTPTPRKTLLTFKTTKQQAEAIRALAQKQGKAVSAFLHEIITNYLNK